MTAIENYKTKKITYVPFMGRMPTEAEWLANPAPEYVPEQPDKPKYDRSAAMKARHAAKRNEHK